MYRPFKPCPRTDCVENQTKHAQLTLLLKEAKEKLAQKEGLLQASVAQTESYDQRLQAAHTDLEAYDKIVPQLEAKYIEEKKKNDHYAELKTENLELKQTMADKAQGLTREERRAYNAIIDELKQRVLRLEQLNSTAEEYIEKTEANRQLDQKAIISLEDKIRELQNENGNLATKNRQIVHDVDELLRERSRLQSEVGGLKRELVVGELDTERLRQFHEDEKQKLRDKIGFEQKRLEDFQSDTEAIREQFKEDQGKLAEKEAETLDLTNQLKKITDRIGTEGGARTEEEEEALEKYTKLARDLIEQMQNLHECREPQFRRKPGAYRSKIEKQELPGSSSSSSTTWSSSSEAESTHDEQGETEEDLSPDLQLISRARRGRGGHGAGPAGEPIVKIKEVEVIREVQVPGPIEYVDHEVLVPGPIQYVDREVPVPGPTVYVNAEGDDIPAKVRYTPFRVFAHNPIICWLLVEFNFLVLFIHWAQRLFVLGSWAYAQVSGGEAWTRLVPDYASSSSETDSNVAGAPPQDAPRPRRPRPGVFTVLFNPQPGRIPSAWDTLWGLAFHFLVYGTLWLFFSVWHERGLWLAENEGARRWLHLLIAQRGSDGSLGINQILPQTINRQLDILRFDFLELVGIPVTYQSPG